MPESIERFVGEYEFLSNMYIIRPIVLSHEGEKYAFQSSEALYILSKLPFSHEWATFCSDHSREPKKLKVLYRNYKHLERPDWNDVKLDVMLRCLMIKFDVESYSGAFPLVDADGNDLVLNRLHDFSSRYLLRKKLINTGNRMIIEGNTWGDIFWGKSLQTMYGENWLGRLLMFVRAILEYEAAERKKSSESSLGFDYSKYLESFDDA